MHDEGQVEELKQAQLRLKAAEEELARSTTDEQEAAQHKRRAEKASYLAKRLREREASERDTDPEP